MNDKKILNKNTILLKYIFILNLYEFTQIKFIFILICIIIKN